MEKSLHLVFFSYSSFSRTKSLIIDHELPCKTVSRATFSTNVRYWFEKVKKDSARLSRLLFIKNHWGSGSTSVSP